MSELSPRDREMLEAAISISEESLTDSGKTPFGAVVTIGGELIATGTSSVIELCDPTAHAEVMAIRSAAKKLGRHLMPDATMYCSSEPCPLCLAACYWAQIPRLVFGATSYDVATYGFEDLQLYRELGSATEKRSLAEEAATGALRDRAVFVLREWAGRLPFPVVPKF